MPAGNHHTDGRWNKTKRGLSVVPHTCPSERCLIRFNLDIRLERRRLRGRVLLYSLRLLAEFKTISLHVPRDAVVPVLIRILSGFHAAGRDDGITLAAMLRHGFCSLAPEIHREEVARVIPLFILTVAITGEIYIKHRHAGLRLAQFRRVYDTTLHVNSIHHNYIIPFSVNSFNHFMDLMAATSSSQMPALAILFGSSTPPFFSPIME